ncbi:hypothetical protein SAMN04488696_0546 [Methanolobus profundi]|uniref:Zinc-ribbon domain-containing protein n=1 Tax=Methanolobus profundi TaxID=487685 RepID=A0A1I4PAV1_9EURY|nr:hypothetical protein SAMN04488696_0546 [Methanolobus profundi]
MMKLEKCPECNSELNENEHVQFCRTCGYWTNLGTVRFDPISLLD